MSDNSQGNKPPSSWKQAEEFWSSASQDFKSFVYAIVFLVIGVIVLCALKSILGLDFKGKGEALSIALLLLPMLVFLIFSGRIKEFKAGDISAKFADVSQQPVNVDPEQIAAEGEEVQEVSKRNLSELNTRIRELDPTKPVFMSLTLGGSYDLDALDYYFHRLSESRNFKFVIFLNRDKSFTAYAPARIFWEWVRDRERSEECIRLIKEGNIDRLRMIPGFITKVLSTTSSNVEALQEMNERRLDDLVVLDAGSKEMKVVNRQQILSKMMLAIAKK